MDSQVYAELAGHLVDPHEAPALEVLGPTIQYLTPPEGDGREPCVMLGTIPPGVCVPVHSHHDPETFLMCSGRLDALRATGDGFGWDAIGAGQIFHVPGNVKHAWRNRSPEPAVTVIVSTVKIGRFFGEVGTPVGPAGTTTWPPTQRAIERLLETARRYGYWNASPEENAAVGLELG
jgi:quercetin dioxygenase-like cupin family protein